ncbi:MAG: DMT family protein [Bdellovibrionaceae bacterium]|nr:DMT family protein [Pseudobdellovibrionaceae bacterium]MDW8190978.1 DMT family protein [Pseudobdellovibrionaceae bacterium]
MSHWFDLYKTHFITITLLIFSNMFMTFAWYGHLRFKDKALWSVIVSSWLIAFFEYCLQVPANRIGSNVMTAPQLKIIQEVITFLIFILFSIFYLKQIPDRNDYIAALLVIVAVIIALKKPF